FENLKSLPETFFQKSSLMPEDLARNYLAPLSLTRIDEPSPPRFMGAMRVLGRGSLIMDEMGTPGALTRRGVTGP
ncbi:MAG: hypothetical protein NT154_44985, partial [Verrucomicrobia bacterium]|nr:hypothetical protein [Verrucomicrobiota bacterium]